MNLRKERTSVASRGRNSTGVLAAALWAAASTIGLAHTHSGYSWESEIGASNPDWMAQLLDEVDGQPVLVSHLSLPGTHDTISIVPGSDSAQTQTASLEEQLNAGIRVLDIRLRLDNDEFEVWHGDIPGLDSYLGLFVEDVVTVCRDFLDEHPGETIFMRVKEEGGPSGENTLSFGELFNQIRGDYPGLFWSHNLVLDAERANPRLSAIRGQIVVMRNNGGLSTNFGIPWPGGVNTTGENGPKQERYVMTTNWDLYSKWEYVRNHLKRASEGDQGTIFVNSLVGSGGSFPYFVVSGHSSPQTGASRLWTLLTDLATDTYVEFPRLAGGIYFEGTNVLTTDFLNQSSMFSEWEWAGAIDSDDPPDPTTYPPIVRIGMIITDFPGPGLINAVIAKNDFISAGLVNTARDRVLVETGSGSVFVPHPGSLREKFFRRHPVIRFTPGLNGQTLPIEADILLKRSTRLEVDPADLPSGIRLSSSSPVRIGP